MSNNKLNGFNNGIDASDGVGGGQNINQHDPKYLYYLLTWGGFYNEEHKKIHGHEPGDAYFSTYEERDRYIRELMKISDKLNAKELMIATSEGYYFGMTTLHRISKYKDRIVHTMKEMEINYSLISAEYHLDNKWYPGFNDYPFGEDFNYDDNDFKVLQEWITGAILDETCQLKYGYCTDEIIS